MSYLDKWASSWDLKIFVVEIFTPWAFEIWYNIIGGQISLVVLTQICSVKNQLQGIITNKDNSGLLAQEPLPFMWHYQV